jgi:DNA-binding FrmR family transcriptional regulator
MAHVIRDQAALLKRTRRLKGQVEAVERSIADGAECGDVLQQIAAVRGAANSLMIEVLEGHVREHLGVRPPAELDSLLTVIRRYIR